MEKLSLLLHRLVDHAVPQGNEVGELHAMADDAVAEVARLITDAAELGEAAASLPPAPNPAARAPSPAPPFTAPKSDGAA